MITAATLSLIQDASKIIHYTRTIFDFIILAQYLLHSNKILFYMKHALYKLDKTKIAFENHYSIDTKLFWPTFNHLKFHIITHFVKRIRDYKNVINFDMAYNNTAYQYFVKTFYRRINKKKYKLQNLKHNIYYNNIIVIQNIILMAKVLNESTRKNSLLLICLM